MIKLICFVLHLCFIPGGRQLWDNLLTSKVSRAAWEEAFDKAYITPVVEVG